MRCGHRCLVFCLSFLCVAGAQAQDDIAVTREILVSAQMPPELRGAVHTTALSPDGRYVYIIGPSAQVAPPPGGGMAGNVLRSPATLLKVDAMTLQPIKQLAVGGRTHHAQVFQDRYLLIDTFVSEPNGLDVFLFDPQNWEVVAVYPYRGYRGDWIVIDSKSEYFYVPATGAVGRPITVVDTGCPGKPAGILRFKAARLVSERTSPDLSCGATFSGSE